MSTSMDSPAYKVPRTLVLCFDGTSNEFDGTNTNVVKFFSLLKKDEMQLCYYQAGIGTYTDPGILSPTFLWLAKILDQAIAWYLDAHVMGGYKFLMQNYRPGDKICLFGFSRGAYTARALAGMLNKIGLLPRDNFEQVPFAYKMYKRTDTEGITLSAAFKQTYCRSVVIEFLGVWDTVASVGLLRSCTLPFTNSNSVIKTFRHALSLDEHRAKFRPTLYHRLAPNAAAAKKDPEQASPVAIRKDTKDDAGARKGKKFWTALRRGIRRGSVNKSATERNLEVNVESDAVSDAESRKGKEPMLPKEDDGTSSGEDVRTKKPLRQMTLSTSMATKHDHNQADLVFHPDRVANPEEDLRIETNNVPGEIETDVLEVWFAGCHGDVGGGNTPDGVSQTLSDIPLRWMVREVALSQCGVTFDTFALSRLDIPSTAFAKLFPEADGSPIDSAIGCVDSPVHLHQTTHCGEEGVANTSSVACVKGTVRGANGKEDKARSDDLDALAPIHDQLKANVLWWLLEIIPLPYSWQDDKGVWHKKWSFHLGKGRYIPTQHPKFHVTVRERIQDPALKYKPKATFPAGSQVYTY